MTGGAGFIGSHLGVKALTSSASEIVHVPYDRAYGEGFEDLRRRVPDIGKLRALTGFSPEFSLDATIDKVIRYYRDGRDRA